MTETEKGTWVTLTKDGEVQEKRFIPNGDGMHDEVRMRIDELTSINMKHGHSLHITAGESQIKMLGEVSGHYVGEVMKGIRCA